MENPVMPPGAISYQWAKYASNNPYYHRNEVIDRLSRSPVKVRHWLLSNDFFQAGLDVLNPSSSAWIEDQKVRNVIKLGLIRMLESAVDFISTFPDVHDPGM